MTIKASEEHSEAIIVYKKPYGESDALITCYTREYGKITVKARGVQKINSKNAPALDVYNYADLTLIPRKGISTLIKATLLDYHRHIKEDLLLTAYASFFMEYVYRYVNENEPDLKLYELLKDSLDALSYGYHERIVYLIFLAKILEMSGMKLQVDHCAHCDSTAINAISFTAGGFVCYKHQSVRDIAGSKDVLKAFRHINKVNMKNAGELNLDLSIIKELEKIMEYYVFENAGLHFQSYKFIKQLR